MDFVFSINVHENVPFLMKQLQNIKDHVSNYVVLLSCNRYMYKKLSQYTLSNVVLNPTVIEKKRYHGSLTHGIYYNILYAQQFKFSYFIVLSSRNLFYQTLTKNMKKGETCDSWMHWPCMKKTLLSNHYQNENLYCSAHEGLVFDSSTCKKIIQFLENHQDIKRDLFYFPHCVEEFALQTIAVNEGNGYYDIGCGSETQDTIPTDPTKYVYKTLRL
jgi:hypothetical protein